MLFGKKKKESKKITDLIYGKNFDPNRKIGDIVEKDRNGKEIVM